MISVCSILVVLFILPPSQQTRARPVVAGVLRHKTDGRKTLHLPSLDVEVKLRPASSTLASAGYTRRVWKAGQVSVNRTVALPTCIYSGSYSTQDITLLASVSACDRTTTLGTLVWNGIQHVIERDTRSKRQAEFQGTAPSEDQLIVREQDVEHECGLNTKNVKRMTVDESPVVDLQSNRVRKKRSIKDRYIELSVFVDEQMYSSVESTKQESENTLEKIQNIVFTYLNAVQLIYQSNRLTNRIKLTLVRLDILQSKVSGLESQDGDIERYLESFCEWQQSINPGTDAGDDSHWDHALLLTGYNLFDGLPERDSVIGLAWVSGMCHPDYSCTINEGNNFESVFVIAHEMGHNLGMNHDGETLEGNTCSPNKYLMSPILGPGKVTWSSCSDKELSKFLLDPKTQGQASCLDDVPKGIAENNFDLDGKSPGEVFSANDQCRQAYGKTFSPYVKDESPFEDLCRELWCSNITHALRAHPALEGTDCSSKPYPYGSICDEGVCVPFDPNKERSEEEEKNSKVYDEMTTEDVPMSNSIDDTPDWYDPLYAKIFRDLREQFVRENPLLYLSQSSRETKASSLRRRGEQTALNITEDRGSINLTLGEGRGAVWHMHVEDCPVHCGGGWAGVNHLCQYSGESVDQSLCKENQKPVVSKLPCGINPC